MHILALSDCPRGISALLCGVPFDFVDRATSGTEVVVGLHTIVLCVLSACLLDL